jgi:hypothetical protein
MDKSLVKTLLVGAVVALGGSLVVSWLATPAQEDYAACVGKEYAKEVELRKEGEWRRNLGARPIVVAQKICRGSNLNEWEQFRIVPEFKVSGAMTPDWTAQDKQRAFDLCVEKLTPRLLPEFEDQAPEKCRKLIQSLQLEDLGA